MVRKRAVFRSVWVAGFSCGLASPVGAGTFWARERPGGVVEFTNKPPPATGGGKWKVWLRAGPGKASALRGSTDIVPARDTSAGRFSRHDQAPRDQQAL